jgi:hypothetical protein
VSSREPPLGGWLMVMGSEALPSSLPERYASTVTSICDSRASAPATEPPLALTNREPRMSHASVPDWAAGSRRVK